MRFLVIFLIFFGFLLGISHVNAVSCPFNYDWPSAPCLDQNNPELVEKAKKEWSRYADIKTDRFLEIYKNEMINAIQYDVLEDWLELKNNSRNKNVFTYYSIYDENFDSYFQLPKKDKFDGTCIIEIDLQNAKEILSNDKTVSEFMQKHPNARVGPPTGVDESLPPQSSVSFVGINETLYVRIVTWSGEKCFVPISYKISSNNDGSFHSYVNPPLKQFKSGVSINEIKCKDTLVLIQKHDGSPACVKGDTIAKIMNRGWMHIDSKIQDDFTISYHIIGGIVNDVAVYGKEPKLCTGPGCLVSNASSFTLINISANDAGRILFVADKSILDHNNLVDDGFIVINDGEETGFMELSNSTHTILIVEFSRTSSEIEIVGYSSNYDKLLPLN